MDILWLLIIGVVIAGCLNLVGGEKHILGNNLREELRKIRGVKFGSHKKGKR